MGKSGERARKKARVVQARMMKLKLMNAMEEKVSSESMGLRADLSVTLRDLRATRKKD
jgi:hypothetical protein